jgi:SsrA-binding protein
MWMYNLHIAEYAMGSWTNHGVRRKRKLLLLHRSEILNWEWRGARERPVDGAALDVLQRREGEGRARLVKGKKTWDKHRDLAEWDAQSEIERALSRHIKGRVPT